VPPVYYYSRADKAVDCRCCLTDEPSFREDSMDSLEIRLNMKSTVERLVEVS